MNLTQFQQEIAKRDGRISVLESLVEQLQKRMEALEAKPKRGRPSRSVEKRVAVQDGTGSVPRIWPEVD